MTSNSRSASPMTSAGYEQKEEERAAGLEDQEEEEREASERNGSHVSSENEQQASGASGDSSDLTAERMGVGEQMGEDEERANACDEYNLSAPASCLHGDCDLQQHTRLRIREQESSSSTAAHGYGHDGSGAAIPILRDFLPVHGPAAAGYISGSTRKRGRQEEEEEEEPAEKLLMIEDEESLLELRLGRSRGDAQPTTSLSNGSAKRRQHSDTSAKTAHHHYHQSHNPAVTLELLPSQIRLPARTTIDSSAQTSNDFSCSSWSQNRTAVIKPTPVTNWSRGAGADDHPSRMMDMHMTRGDGSITSYQQHHYVRVQGSQPLMNGQQHQGSQPLIATQHQVVNRSHPTPAAAAGDRFQAGTQPFGAVHQGINRSYAASAAGQWSTREGGNLMYAPGQTDVVVISNSSSLGANFPTQYVAHSDPLAPPPSIPGNENQQPEWMRLLPPAAWPPSYGRTDQEGLYSRGRPPHAVRRPHAAAAAPAHDNGIAANHHQLLAFSAGSSINLPVSQIVRQASWAPSPCMSSLSLPLRLSNPPAPSGRLSSCQHGFWFTLQAARSLADSNQELPALQRIFIRIRDRDMRVLVIKRYLMKKLSLSNEEEVEITCRGRILASTSTMQHVCENIWVRHIMTDDDKLGFRNCRGCSLDAKEKLVVLFYQKYTESMSLKLLEG